MAFSWRIWEWQLWWFIFQMKICRWNYKCKNSFAVCTWMTYFNSPNIVVAPFYSNQKYMQYNLTIYFKSSEIKYEDVNMGNKHTKHTIYYISWIYYMNRPLGNSYISFISLEIPYSLQLNSDFRALDDRYILLAFESLIGRYRSEPIHPLSARYVIGRYDRSDTNPRASNCTRFLYTL